MAKRMLDLLVSTVVGILVLPLLLVLMIAIKLDSPGGALFIQPRVGRNGRPFLCYKLRTMHVGTAQVLTHQSQSSAVTRVGQIMRRTKLDELPQLYNVLIGDMSLVGPRPGLVTDQTLTALRTARGVLHARPGITGLAQVMAVDMSQPIKLAAIDADYVTHRSMIMDLELLIATVLKRFRRRSWVRSMEAADLDELRASQPPQIV